MLDKLKYINFPLRLFSPITNLRVKLFRYMGLILTVANETLVICSNFSKAYLVVLCFLVSKVSYFNVSTCS